MVHANVAHHAGTHKGGQHKSIFDFLTAKKDAEQPFFMDEATQGELTDRLSKAINIPGFGDEQERQILLKVVQSLDRNTFKFVPKEILDAASSDDKGVPPAVTDALREALPGILAEAVPLPFVPSFIKQAIIGTFLNQLLSALSHGTSLMKPK